MGELPVGALFVPGVGGRAGKAGILGIID